MWVHGLAERDTYLARPSAVSAKSAVVSWPKEISELVDFVKLNPESVRTYCVRNNHLHLDDFVNDSRTKNSSHAVWKTVTKRANHEEVKFVP
jgi:hypothetical protein